MSAVSVENLARAKSSVSPTALEQYERCPYSWRLRYVDAVGGGTMWADEAALGSALHRLLAARLRGEESPPEPALRRHRDWQELSEIV